MTAEEVKDALRRRHPAVAEYGGPGAWTTLEEWANIDLLAFSAWSSKKPPIVGYEVKVSRSDYRRELLKPEKRTASVARCWQFWFAVPKGLLTKQERAYVEPEHFEDGTAFERAKCPARCERWKRNPYLEERMPPIERERRRKTGRELPAGLAYGEHACLLKPHLLSEVKGEIHALGEVTHEYRFGSRIFTWKVCETCGGRGYLRKSIVEEEAPTLWIPSDVGLIEVNPETGRCHVVRRAPLEEPSKPIGDVCQLLRWASYRPDPRHIAEVERQRNNVFALPQAEAA